MGGNGDDRTGKAVSTKVLGGFNAGHTRHLDVGKDQIKVRLFREFNRIKRIVNRGHVMTQLTQKQAK